MAQVQPSFEVSDSNAGTYIKFYETTSYYSSVNQEGWGAPNTDISSIEWATVGIKKRNATISYTIDVFPDLPSTNKEFYVKILGTQFGFVVDEKISSGLYLITYSAGHYNAGNPVVDAIESHYVVIMPKLRCCVQAVRDNIEIPSKSPCDCHDKKITEVSNVEEILRAICDAVECDQLERAQAMINYITSWCSCHCTTC